MRFPDWHDAPARDIVLRALSRVLDSPEFRASQQLSAFLTFSVGRTLEGRGDTLKAYTIATEVLRRPDDFDPTIDPIVRVEATRLRRALERFYGGEGAAESLRILLPRGGYAVAFERAAGPEAAPAASVAAAAEVPSRRRNPLAGLSARLRLRRFDERSPMLWAPIGAAVFGLSFWISSAADPVGRPPRWSGPETALIAVTESSRPTAAPVWTAVEADAAPLEEVAEDVRDALVGVAGLKIRAKAPAGGAEQAEGLVVSLRSTAGDAPRIVARLVCAGDGAILWTATFPHEEAPATIGRSIAGALAERDTARLGTCAAPQRTALRSF